MSDIKLYNGDCLEVMRSIPDKSIDLIVCDPPFATTANEWDTLIDFKELWAQYERIIKDDRAIVLSEVVRLPINSFQATKTYIATNGYGIRLRGETS